MFVCISTHTCAYIHFEYRFKSYSEHVHSEKMQKSYRKMGWETCIRGLRDLGWKSRFTLHVSEANSYSVPCGI